MPSVADVRQFLDELPAALVSDATIESCLSVAEAYINEVKSSDADPTLVDKAIQVYAAYLTLNAHAISVEKAGRVIPEPLARCLAVLREESERLIEAVKGRTPEAVHACGYWEREEP